MLIKEEFGIANSVEEATKIAIEKLGFQDSDYKIEIIDDVKPKVLGLFGGHPAKVRAYVELPDKPAKKRAKKPSLKATEKPQKAIKEEKPTVELDYKSLDEIDENSAPYKTAKYLINILEKMGVENVTIKAAVIENGTQLLIDGENLGVVIGRRGETLDALQYLASFAANASSSQGYYRIVLDVCGYREKRENTLKSLAKRMASQAIRTGRNRSLEPMNPYERRIIHTVVQGIDGVSSHSVGDGINRHVVITPDGASNRRGQRGERSNSRGRRPQESKTVEAPKREPRSDLEGESLYGRIG